MSELTAALGEVAKEASQKLGSFLNANPDKLVRPERVREASIKGRDVPKAADPDRLQGSRRSLEELKSQYRPKDAQFVGEPGNSLALPDVSRDSGREAKALLEERGLKGIEYKNGFPDFSKAAFESVTIDGMSSNKAENYKKAYTAAAEKWNAEAKDGRTDWKPSDVKAWKKENHLALHEDGDLKTCVFVPEAIHKEYKHIGGRCMAKLKETEQGVSRGGSND